MPLYEYECESCGDRFEKLVSVSKGSKGITCPGCKSKSVRKLMSACARVSSKDSSVGECPTCTTGTCGL